MNTLAVEFRKMFLEILRNDVLETQDHAETLARTEHPALTNQIKSELDAAYKHLFAARVQVEQEIEAL